MFIRYRHVGDVATQPGLSLPISKKQQRLQVAVVSDGLMDDDRVQIDTALQMCLKDYLHLCAYFFSLFPKLRDKNMNGQLKCNEEQQSDIGSCCSIDG